MSYKADLTSNLTPGGYVELQEIGVFVASDDGTLTEDHSLSKWTKLLYDASEKLGRPYIEPGKLKDVLAETGFIDVTETRFKWPSNGWPKDKKHKVLGLWNNENFDRVLEAVSLAPFTRALDWTSEEVTVFMANARKELNDPKIHAYWPMYAFLLGFYIALTYSQCLGVWKEAFVVKLFYITCCVLLARLSGSRKLPFGFHSQKIDVFRIPRSSLIAVRFSSS
jgi:hypothetical protein